MLELLKEVLDRVTRISRLMSCVGFAGYVTWKADFVMPETYDDLAVPALMALFAVSLVFVGVTLFGDQQRDS